MLTFLLFESLAIMSTVKRFCCDDETGEVIVYEIDDETGEPSVEGLAPAFVAPYPQTPHETTKRYTKFPNCYISKSKKFQLLKENILAGSNTISHRMLLIPTLMIPGFVCAILMVLEVFLHVKCHKKNKNLKNPTLQYRSPFHIITSIFCAVCRECESASKIEQLQDKRRCHYDYLRGIAI